MRPSWVEEFEKNYNKPHIEQVTVGFSGIDPQKKCDCSEDISDELDRKLKELKILIDSGNIDPDPPDPPIEPVQPTILTTDHEELDNLLGGNEDGHYHLTDAELQKLQNMPAQGMQGVDGKSATIRIGTVRTGEAGSTARVTNSGTDTDAVLDFTIPKGEKGEPGEPGATGQPGAQGIQGIQGAKGLDGKTATIRIGNVTSGSSPNVTNTGTATDAVLNFVLPKGEKGDKGNDGEQGVKGDKGDKGDTGAKGADGQPATIRVGTVTTGVAGSNALVTQRGTDTNVILDFVIPKGDTGDNGADAVIGEIDHEELDGLLGGTDGEHYHMTATEYRRLRILVGKKGFFPYDDTDDIYIPYIDARDPDNPILLPYTPFENLPKGTPPEWSMAALPTGYLLNSRTGYMYYGDFPSSTYSNGLFVKLYTGNIYRYVNTKDLISWKTISGNDSDFDVYDTGIYNTGDGYIIPNSTVEVLYLINDTRNGTTTYSSRYIKYGFNSNAIKKVSPKSSAGGFYTSKTHAIVSPELGILLLIGVDSSGKRYLYRKIKGTDGSDATSYTVSTPNNITNSPCGLAWSPDARLFCISGAGGTSTSADGITWTLHKDAPKNLTDLTYRTDLECFFARCIDDKCFYVSGDGIEWQKLTAVPIPLETVSCVDYSPETKLYCAVGGTGRYAYFSKDLTTWAQTTVTNGTDIDMGSVIYMPSTGLYVLMPTSGSYYYTFDPSQWTDN